LPEVAAAAHYVPPPLDVPAWQLWLGSAAGFFPFAVASYEFGKRVLIQQRCALCAGSGLVTRTQFGEPRRMKCTACGGFLPWESWELFLRSEVGNGGKLRFPRGQRSVLFDVDAATRASQRMADAASQPEEAEEERAG